ncbi:zinc-dependent peptidase [Marinimicrobium alkaliphilum]|uniref:zinc-dependent peptidase n=1 Tax=Marinimicrobium alkaliphilum TaxID=2202654 RepID=UPI0022B7C2AA|nr:zinc-dependent peptidase [Marinimicrobium alkaliphilum]
MVLHEYAHQVDGESGDMDGAPLFFDPDARRQWQAVMSDAYEHLVDSVERGTEPAIDPYAATAPEEFFAVTTEYFFTAPMTLYSTYPAVYEQLRQYYREETREWFYSEFP